MCSSDLLEPGRSGEADGRDFLGRAGEEWRVIAWPTQAGEPAELPSQYTPPKPHPGCMGPGGIGGTLGRSGEAGGRSHLGGAGEERRRLPCPLEPGSLLSSQPGALTSKVPPTPPPAELVLGAQEGAWGDQERQAEGLSQARGAGEERRAFAPPTGAQEAFWAPR